MCVSFVYMFVCIYVCVCICVWIPLYTYVRVYLYHCILLRVCASECVDVDLCNFWMCHDHWFVEFFVDCVD